MKALQIHSYGGPEVLALQDVPVPEPGSGELLIRVAAAAVNPVDVMIRKGLLKDMTKQPLPLTLGCDVAGTVTKLGEGVQNFQVGDEVYAYLALNRNGAFAEYAIVKEAEAAPKPKTLDFVHAASVPVASLTAWQAIFDAAGLNAGQTILVHGAAGGVGSMTVQLAKWKGAHVIGTGSARNAEYVHALGVDEYIDYTNTRFESEVHDADVVFDTIGGDTQARSFQTLKRGGFLVSSVSPPPPEKAAEYGVRATMIGVQPDGKKLSAIARLVDDHILKTLVETVLPLSEAARAQELSASGHTRGKIVLTTSN